MVRKRPVEVSVNAESHFVVPSPAVWQTRYLREGGTQKGEETRGKKGMKGGTMETERG